MFAVTLYGTGIANTGRVVWFGSIGWGRIAGQAGKQDLSERTYFLCAGFEFVWQGFTRVRLEFELAIDKFSCCVRIVRCLGEALASRRAARLAVGKFAGIRKGWGIHDVSSNSVW